MSSLSSWCSIRQFAPESTPAKDNCITPADTKLWHPASNQTSVSIVDKFESARVQTTRLIVDAIDVEKSTTSTLRGVLPDRFRFCQGLPQVQSEEDAANDAPDSAIVDTPVVCADVNVLPFGTGADRGRRTSRRKWYCMSAPPVATT